MSMQKRVNKADKKFFYHYSFDDVIFLHNALLQSSTKGGIDMVRK